MTARQPRAPRPLYLDSDGLAGSAAPLEPIGERYGCAPPAAGPLTAEYWNLGETGRLHLLRCDDCDSFNHPPVPCCPRCQSLRQTWTPVSGVATLYSFGVNRRNWGGRHGTWVPAVVIPDDAAGVRLFSEVVECPLQDLAIGMALRVDFRRPWPQRRIYLPVFRPAADAGWAP
jgi:uncharacterized OB-fold protein